MTADRADPRRNRLLALLPAPAYEACVSRLEPLELHSRQVLFEYGEPIQHVYFPTASVVSLVVPMTDGTVVECAIVGNEGMVGLPVFLGAESLPMGAFAQVPGATWRMDADAFRALLADIDGPLATVLQRYTHTLFTQLAQNVACNRLHSVEQRCARWLLMTADRLPAGPFLLTHEFLAEMLGVRRAGVSEVAGRLAAVGAIAYRRGVVTVTDRPALEGASCECQGVIAGVLNRMLRPL